MTEGDCPGAADYPARYERRAHLPDGTAVLLRPIRRNDVACWVEFVSGLSSLSRYLRFHYLPRQMGLQDAARFCNVDYQETFGFIAEISGEDHELIIGIGRYACLPGRTSAEIAFVVSDAYQHRGVGTWLLERLVTAGRDHGIHTFYADVLPGNEDMMAVFRYSGLPVTATLDSGVFRVEMDISGDRAGGNPV
jgi:RimJ/RimL family protein N-acetyltransferase